MALKKKTTKKTTKKATTTRAKKKTQRKAKRTAKKTTRKTKRTAKKTARKVKKTVKKITRKAKKATKKTAKTKKKTQAKAKRSEKKTERKEKRTTKKKARQKKKIERKAKRKKNIKKTKKDIKNFFDNISESLKRNASQVWYCENPKRFTYPEMNYKEVTKKPNVGICFSGGGTRSATCSLGQMRAFRELKLEKKFRYVSCISGGAWFAVPYTYMPKKKISEDRFFGPYIKPKDCSISQVERMSSSRNVFSYAISESRLFTFRNLVSSTANQFWPPTFKNSKHDESWGQFLSRVFLKPLKIDNSKKQRFVTWKDSYRSQVLSRNKHLEKNDFNHVSYDRPFLLVGGTIMDWGVVAAAKSIAGFKPLYPFEMTPFYSGICRRYEGREVAGAKKLGGGYIENTAFDTKAAFKKLDEPWTKSRTRINYNRFSIQDMMAISGAAPGHHTMIFEYFADLPFLKKTVIGKVVNAFTGIFPNYDYWHISNKKRVFSHKHDFGDGGFVDNLGIMPMLRREVKKIVVCINTSVKLELTAPQGNPPKLESTSDMLNNGLKIDGAIPLLFGREKLLDGIPYTWNPSKGQVFKSSEFKKVLHGLLEADKSGGAVVCRTSHKVLPNDWHGVKGNYNVEVVWIYNQKCTEWEKQLPKATWRRINATDRKGKPIDKDFTNFPHYKTFKPVRERDSELKETKNILRRVEMVDLKRDQVGLLSQLSSWCVMEANRKGLFKDFFR